jgi:ABC-type multidrug transport system ATPase subunit
LNTFTGPSGCGKSSLLDILADRKDTKGLTGRVLVSGKPRSKNFKYSIGYVVQEGEREKFVFLLFMFIFVFKKISSVEH